MLCFPKENINFSDEEEEILRFWKANNVFQKTVVRSKGKKNFTLFDGPPFASGEPHYGHILSGTVKDILTRYAHQNGYSVERNFGLDCHGLSVEFEIDRRLRVKGPGDVVRIGIEGYNRACKTIVNKYSEEWETTTTRTGRWVDFKHDYKTMDPKYMEGVWWVFSELWNSGMIYKDTKVLPYSTAFNTPLSNFEAEMNYKEVFDPAIIVTFPLVDDPDTSLLVWTTTPWTLPSNLTLCVNPSLDYVKVKDKQSGKYYISLSSRLEFVFKKADTYEVVDTFKGATLQGKRYQPLFDYYKDGLSMMNPAIL